MAEGFWTALVLGMGMISAKVESPPMQPNCGIGEYDYSGICCKRCPAGTYVEEHCSMPHTLSHCADCTEGKDYTAYENSLETCLRCDECSSDKTTVKACTVKSNTECRCKDGYFCPWGCEACLRCKTRCPEGQVTVQNCNATADMECRTPPTGTSHVDGIPVWSYVLAAAVVCLVIVVIVIFLHHKKCCVLCTNEEKSVNDHLSTDSTDDLLPSRKNSNTDALPTESQEIQLYLADPDNSELPENISVPSSSTKEASISGAVALLHLTDMPVTHNVQSNVQPSNAERSVAIKPSHDELSEICEELTNKVLIRDWKTLMRNTGLSDNEIDIITHDYPLDTREQKYRMLKTLYDRFGIENALCKLLNGLRQLKLINIYENLRNELLSKSIIIVEDKGKCLYFVKNAEEQNL